jgi:hypothetical protein
MVSADTRSLLISDRKNRSERSPASVEVACGMRGGGGSSWPMVVKPRAKGARGCEEHLHQRNHRTAR